jgi:hypothetical protein
MSNDSDTFWVNEMIPYGKAPRGSDWRGVALLLLIAAVVVFVLMAMSK